MEVIVVGSGIAGLTAAISLGRAGHRVRIFERTSTATAFGAGVGLSYNGTKVLSALGLDYKANGINEALPTTMLMGSTLKHIYTLDHLKYQKLSGSKQYYAHRVDLQQALIDIATRKERSEGLPAEIIFNAPVESYDADSGSIMLQDGTIHKADLVVAADGVHSQAPQFVLGHPAEVAHTGTTIIRFMLPTERLLSNPKTSGLLESKGQFRFYVGPDRLRWLIQYPVRDNTETNFGMYSLLNNDHDVDEQVYRFKCDKESLKRELHGFHESILDVADMAPEILPIWKLLDRPPLPTWHRGRLVLIGDAAHPSLPNQGQGASMAVEDSAALGTMFSNLPPFITSHTITERLELFERLRKPRASVVQLISHVHYLDDYCKYIRPQMLEHLREEELPEASGGPTRDWFFGYDVMSESRKVLEQHLASRSGNAKHGDRRNGNQNGILEPAGPVPITH